MSKINWIKTEYDGLKAIHNEGDFDGALVTEASVVQGGNELWTPFIYRTSKGRFKKTWAGKLGRTRIRGKIVLSYFPGQQKTKDMAVALCESKWAEIFKPSDTAPDSPSESSQTPSA